MRHSKIELTMAIYTHSQDDKLTAGINNLPDFEAETAENKAKMG
jgi:hypothetical protein